MFALMLEAGYEQRTSHNVRTLWGALDAPYLLLNTVKYRQRPSSETKPLDFDTYTMPGALVWGDLHYLMRLRHWEGSGPKIEGSGTKN